MGNIKVLYIRVTVSMAFFCFLLLFVFGCKNSSNFYKDIKNLKAKDAKARQIAAKNLGESRHAAARKIFYYT